MKVTPVDIANWARSERGKARAPKQLRMCGGTGLFRPPSELRRCPHGCEPYAWRRECRSCGAPTVPLDLYEG